MFRQKQLDNALIMIQRDKWRIKLNKLPYIGASILEIKKYQLMILTITILIIINMMEKLNYCLLITIVSHMKLKLKIFIKIFTKADNYLILSNIQEIQNVMIRQNLLVKWMMKHARL